MSVLAASRREVLEQQLAAAEETGRCIVEVDVRELRSLLTSRRVFEVSPLQLAVLELVVVERERQEARMLSGEFVCTCASDFMSQTDKLAILTEEFLEAVRAVNDGDSYGLIGELVQVAAVAVAWLESIQCSR